MAKTKQKTKTKNPSKNITKKGFCCKMEQKANYLR
jgi:hypothetical protein